MSWGAPGGVRSSPPPPRAWRVARACKLADLADKTGPLQTWAQGAQPTVGKRLQLGAPGPGGVPNTKGHPPPSRRQVKGSNLRACCLAPGAQDCCPRQNSSRGQHPPTWGHHQVAPHCSMHAQGGCAREHRGGVSAHVGPPSACISHLPPSNEPIPDAQTDCNHHAASIKHVGVLWVWCLLARPCPIGRRRRWIV